MPRRNRAKDGAGGTRPPRSLLDGALSWSRTEAGSDGDWVVRSVPGARSRKAYRCPGCDQEIAPGVGHVVAWPASTDADDGAADRRHWHTACWTARGRRRPGRPRRRL